MNAATIGVTGATGGVGGGVAQRLAQAGAAQRLIVRDPDRAPSLGAEVAAAEYNDREAMRAAAAGVDTLLFVSAGEDRDRVTLHRGVVDAAVEAGVRRIVYLSFLNAAADATFTFARDHYLTEEHIRASGVEFTFLRDNLYADYVPMLVGADGVIRGPAGDGVAGLVAREDIADVAAAVLTSDGHGGQTYDITGPELLSLHDAADILSRVTGRSVTYHPETIEEAWSSRDSYGAEQWEVEGWITTYTAIANGELAVVSDVVERLAGHPPKPLEQFLRNHPDRWAHLVAT